MKDTIINKNMDLEKLRKHKEECVRKYYQSFNKQSIADKQLIDSIKKKADTKQTKKARIQVEKKTRKQIKSVAIDKPVKVTSDSTSVAKQGQPVSD